MTDVISCPFGPCDASFTLLTERGQLDTEATVQRIPQHQAGGHEDFGMCPASLMVFPLDQYSQNQLSAQAAIMIRITGDRESAAAQAETEAGPSGAQPEHQLAPHPTPLPSGWDWFGRRPPLRALPADGSNTIGGSAVTSIEDVKNILTRAGELAEEARQAVFVARGAAGESLQLVNVVRNQSVAPIGAPDLIEAVSKMEEALTSLERALAANVEYRGSR